MHIYIVDREFKSQDCESFSEKFVAAPKRKPKNRKHEYMHAMKTRVVDISQRKITEFGKIGKSIIGLSESSVSAYPSDESGGSSNSFNYVL